MFIIIKDTLSLLISASNY